jgi:hypothetical protein
LSDEAKIAYLQERIKEAKKSERSGTVISIFGLILVIFSFLFAVLFIKIMPSPDYLLNLLFFLGIIGGILIIILGMGISINYAIQRGVVMEQLRRMAQNDLGLPHLTMNCKIKY